MSKTSQKNSINLKGSIQLVTEFFGFAINSILYQRGIYPDDSFSKIDKYGIPLMFSKDKGLNEYLRNTFEQLKLWLTSAVVRKLVVVVYNAEDDTEVLERWTFTVDTDQNVSETGSDKSVAVIQGEIRQIMRQIAASVSFLPVLDVPASFEILVHCEQDAAAPDAWAETDPHVIMGKEHVVKLATMSTKVHTISSSVSYRDYDGF